jgi:putative transposase
MHEELFYEGESLSLNRVARLMAAEGLQGIPQRRAWRRKGSGSRPIAVSNHLERDFSAAAPNERWVTDITYIRTGEGWLYLAAVIDLYNNVVIGWSMSARQDRQLVLKAVLMAIWQREDNSPVVLHSDRGTQFTSGEYQAFLRDHHVICSMSAVGHCGDNAAAEGFFGLLKRDRVRRRRYLTHAEARSDVFDYIERFHNPRMRRRVEQPMDQNRRLRNRPQWWGRTPLRLIHSRRQGILNLHRLDRELVAHNCCDSAALHSASAQSCAPRKILKRSLMAFNATSIILSFAF